MGLRGAAARNLYRWAAGLALGAALACSGGSVRLGAVLPLTGPYAAYGASLKQGLDLAVEQVNAAGGVGGRRLELSVRDSGSEPGRAARAFEDLVAGARVGAVVGGCTSGEALAMVPVAQRLGRVLLSPSASSPSLAAAGEWFFRTWPSDDEEGRTLAEFAAFTLHATRVLAAYEGNAYAEGLVKAFAARFASADRSCRELPLGAGAPEEVAARVAGAAGDAQVLFVAGYGADVLPVLGALNGAGLERPLLSVSAMAEGRLLQRYGAQAEGVILARPAFDPRGDDAQTQEFVAAYRARYKASPDIYAAHGYDAVRMLAGVMAGGGTSARSVREGLAALRSYDGAAGLTTFDGRGGVSQPYQLCVVEQGRVVPLKDVLDKVLPPLQAQVERRRFGR